MGFYAEQVLPRAIDVALRGRDVEQVRRRVSSGLSGDVLEIGFGSGRNLPYYPSSVTSVRAVDPAAVGRKLAAQRVAECHVPVEYMVLDAATLPIGDESVDHVLVTWTLCTVPEVVGALGEIRRVLRRGGRMHFVEHGHSPDERVARRQDRWTPVQRRIAGGCHLNRRIDELIAGAGLHIERLDTYYLTPAKAVSYQFEGVAVRPDGR